MKKKVFSLLLLASAIFSAPAMAANHSPSCASDTSACQKGPRMNRPGRCLQAFEGLKLSDAQKTRLQALSLNMRPDSLPVMTAPSASDQATQAQGRPAKNGRKDGGKEAQARRADYLKGVKEILTPEQYVQFLENSFVQSAPSRGKDMKASKAGKHGKGKHGKAGKDGGKKDRERGRSQGTAQK